MTWIKLVDSHETIFYFNDLDLNQTETKYYYVLHIIKHKPWHTSEEVLQDAMSVNTESIGLLETGNIWDLKLLYFMLNDNL